MFTLTIETYGAAFNSEEEAGTTATEVARIMHALASLLERTEPDTGGGKVRDINGNTCGSWVLS